MRSFLARIGGFVGLLVVFASLAAACTTPGSTKVDTSEPVNLEKGRRLFQQQCRACHALADADAAGVFGPDLDDLQPDTQRVREQIDSGGGGMPDDLLTGKDADTVARYVAEVAGKGASPDDQPTTRGNTKGRGND